MTRMTGTLPRWPWIVESVTPAAIEMTSCPADLIWKQFREAWG